MFIKSPINTFFHLYPLKKYLKGIDGFISGGCFKNVFKHQKIRDIDIFFKNQEDFDNLPSAASIYNLVKYYLNRKKVVEILLQHIEVDYIKLLKFAYKQIDQEYCAVLKNYNTPFTYRYEGALKIGFLKGVHCSGKLIVLEDGVEKQFGLKEIEWVL